MATVYLGLGSNLGERQQNIQRAIQLLNKNTVTVTKISRIIETDPVGGIAQPKYLNAVIETNTDLPPQKLLALIKNIERFIGRKPTVRNGPRKIDIDILLYGELKISAKDLTIPHPRIQERLFVLTPLREIAPHIAQRFRHEDPDDH